MLGSRWGRGRKEGSKGGLAESRGRCMLGPKNTAVVFGGHTGPTFLEVVGAGWVWVLVPGTPAAPLHTAGSRSALVGGGSDEGVES